MKKFLKAALTLAKKTPTWTYALVAAAIAFAIQENAFAFAAPAQGAFAYEIYDFMVLRLLQGPVGFCLGVGCMVAGGLQAFRNALLQGAVIASCGFIIMNADNLVTALGAVI